MQNKIHIVFFMMFASATLGYSQDTLWKNHGAYEVGKLNKKGYQTGWLYSYDSLGLLQNAFFYDGNDARRSRYKRKIEYNYSDNGVLIETGKKTKKYGKYGRWFTYDTTGELLKIERYKKGDLHGWTKYLKEDKKIKYYLGHTKEELYNSKGQRLVFYFTVGMPTFRNYSCYKEIFACEIIQIAGCGVSQETERRRRVHNFWVNLRQITRYGFSWQEKMFSTNCE